MSRVILQPAGGGDAKTHFFETVESPVPLSRIRPFVSDEVFFKLQSLFKEGKVPIWGVTPGKKDVNKNKFENVQSGDVALFFGNKEIFSSATVAFTTHNKNLALELWKTDSDGETWEYIYFLDEVGKRKIPQETFNKAADYKSNYITQGFNVLGNDKGSKILAFLDLESETYFPEVPKEDYLKSISEPSPDVPLDKSSVIKSRTEQAFLRNQLFKGQRIGVCGICGKEFPINFLVAAHIKKRADCEDTEKRDYQHIIMPMCKFGCDDLYEKGYIAVRGGRVIDTQSKFKNENIEYYLRNIVGGPCSYWTPETENYFLWHDKLNTNKPLGSTN